MRVLAGGVVGNSPEDTILIRAEDLSWQDRGLCMQTDPELWFPDKGGSVRDAKRICRSCEVQAECLEYALANDERHGVWGAKSAGERRRIQAERAAGTGVAA